MRIKPFDLLVAAVVGLVVGLLMPRHEAIAGMPADPASKPSSGFALHIDAEKHFGDAHPDEIAHHWCKTISATLTECQLYASDGPHARQVGVETIVPIAVWKTFPRAEQRLWHYHKTEIPKVHATLPDTPKDQQAKIVASIEPTYGKIWILWDPESTKNPIGQPSVTVLH